MAGLGPRFYRLWAASAVSNLGDGVMGVALPLLVASLTRDPVLVATATVVNRLPWFLFALIAGALVDRMDRRRVMVVTDFVRFSLVGVLGGMLLVGDVGLPVVYVIAFALGTAETFFDTSAEAFLPAIVASGALPAANGRLQATEWVGNAFVGPALGAFLFSVAAGVPFLVDAGTYLFAAVAVAAIAGTYRPDRDTAASLRADIAEGLRWLWGHAVLRTLAIMAGITNMMGFAIIAIFVLFVQDIAGVGDIGYGIILSAVGAGGLLGAVLAPKVTQVLGPAGALIGSVVLTAIAAGAMIFLSHPVAVGAVSGLYGVAITLWNVVAVSLRMRLTPDELRGRVASVARLLAWGTQPLGALAGGLVAGSFGLRAPFLIAAAASVGMVVLVAPIINNRRIADLEAGVS